MSEGTSSSPPKVRIASASDLFDILTEGSFEARVGVMQSIIKDPKRPLSLGKHGDEDFIDLLIGLFKRNEDGLSRLYLMCLSCYQDPRTTTFLTEEFSRSRDASAVLHLGRRLSIEREADFFRQFLWQDKSAQALAAARLLVECESLTSKEKLRMALILDAPYEPPAIGPQTLDLWTAELNGSYRARARALAEQRGKEVLQFWERWSELASIEREWLVSQTVRLNPTFACSQLDVLLAEPSTPFPIVRQALALGLPLPSSALSSEHERVRALAVAKGFAGDRLEQYLEASIPEAVAATGQFGVEKLLELLADRRWQVRATASEALASLEECPLEELRTRAGSQLLSEKIAALDVLRRVGDQEWLRDFVSREGR